MSWEAANAPKLYAAAGHQQQHDYEQQHQTKRGESCRISSETIEAALSRLSKAYNSAMECIGSINKTDTMLIQTERNKRKEKFHGLDNENGSESKNDALNMIEKVSVAARTTFERALLLDSLMLPYVPLLQQSMIELSYEGEYGSDSSDTTPPRKWNIVNEQRLPPTISSAAHKAKLMKLCYLSLVNYSDLLQSSCRCSKISAASSIILDRGIVPKLKSLQNPGHRSPACWKSEDPEVTQSLAVAALCDASNMDPSDPILWLKLACASRTLEYIVAKEDSTVEQSQHRRLQRYALERGIIALPPHVPPNRTVTRALREFSCDQKPDEYLSKRNRSTYPRISSKTLKLTRYSWSVLGRMIIRACKGDGVTGLGPVAPWEDSSIHSHNHHQRFEKLSSLPFGSPVIVLELSQMLVLPSKVLGKICQYLENTSIWKFEATCRALSVNIIAARACMEEYDDGSIEMKRRQQVEEQSKSQIISNDQNEFQTRHANKSNSHLERDKEMLVASSKAAKSRDLSDGTTNEKRKGTESSTAKPRTSQRLRSREISTGKKQERESNRKSLDYCFVAATLSCTVKCHDTVVDRLREKKNPIHRFEGNENSLRISGQSAIFREGASNESFNTSLIEANERISDASINAFVKKFSSKNSGPVDLLEDFLSHVAFYTENVFTMDSPTAGLHSCITLSFQFLHLRTGSYQSIVPRFFQPVERTGSILHSLEKFAMDLLYSELILKQCDRCSPKIVEFDDDANIISLMIPVLVESCDLLSHALRETKGIMDPLLLKFNSLQIRCYWLTARFYLWKSRFARSVFMSREAEDEAIHFIEITIKCFDLSCLQADKTIRTPHLVSPGRQDAYWHGISPTSLTKFRDEIQASAVVSYARQRFQERVSQLEEIDSGGKELPMNDAKILAEIGQKLFERYNSKYGSSDSKLLELVENFLVIHGGDLMQDEKYEINHFIQIEPCNVADLQRVSGSSILSMLIICLNMDNKNRLSVAQLLVRLVLTVRDHHSLLLKQIADFRATRKRSDEYYTDDSDDDMSDNEQHNSSQKDDDEKKATQCGHLIKVLVNVVCFVLRFQLSGKEKSELLMLHEFSEMVRSALDFSNKWFQSTVHYLSIPDDGVDRDIFLSILDLLTESRKVTSDTMPNNIEFVFRRGMVYIVICQKEILNTFTTSQVNRANKSSRQRLCVKRAHYIGLVVSQLGSLLSLNLAHVDDFIMNKCPLFACNHLTSNATDSEVLNYEEEIIFLHAVRWLRKYAAIGDSENSNLDNVCSSFNRPIIKELRIPMATLIIGLCGSSSSSHCDYMQTYIQSDDENDSLSLHDVADSDCSINDWGSDDEEEDEIQNRKKLLIKVVCHATHCIISILEKIEDKDIVTKLLGNDCSAEFGPLLPLVAVRVLNFFAETLLLNFGEDESDGKNKKLLWSPFPFKTRNVGELLDAALHKTYRWLYGFALIGEQVNQLNTGNELSYSVNTLNEIAVRSFKLENTTAAGKLYRCIVRAYAGGRRAPPKKALELVSAALPSLRESELNKALRMFALSGDNVDLNMDSLLSMDEQSDFAFKIIKDSVSESSSNVDAPLNEAMQVRRGLSKQLAFGPLPVLCSDPKKKSDGGIEDNRSQTIQNEKAIAKKFNAILDDLCLSDSDNWEGWYRASQCCTMKADAIADRLGLTLGFTRTKSFSIPSNRSSYQGVEISNLEEEQEKEEVMSKRTLLLGHDYSFFINSTWSSLSSLRSSIISLKEKCEADNNTNNSDAKKYAASVWDEINLKYKQGNFLECQEALGGVFVFALRKLSIRLMCVALYVIQCKPNNSIAQKQVILSDICEALGNTFYSELMASQHYSYPIRTITSKRKRNLAFIAKACYQAAIKHADDSIVKDQQDSEDHCTWDLLFMIGKCEEKIAGTYTREAFTKQTRAERNNRLYEKYMGAAFLVYSQAFQEVKKLEEGGQVNDQAGGSGHGSMEVHYRLHASRLKCLIHAVSRHEEERGQAELEALRLTEKYRFKESDGELMKRKKDPRERIWVVLADVVDGLVECRRLKQFFHRSVYRHAQALMWSPLFYDPASNNSSMDTVPAIPACQIIGLDSSKPAVHSAKSVISALFSKRHSQLVAVWVTTTGPTSPFQVLNTTIRKYDSLRGKYISAYLETLKRCRCRTEVETFMRWLYTSKRDLPSYFQAGAVNGDGVPANPQTQDRLLHINDGKTLMSNGFLVSCKRIANSALADILLKEISETTDTASLSSSSKSNKLLDSTLKSAYACYIRLNCTTKDLKKARAWKYGAECISELDALCKAYLSFDDKDSDSSKSSDFGDWSGKSSAIFDAALIKCKKEFPSLSGNFLPKAKSGSSKNKNKGKSIDGTALDPYNNKAMKRKSTTDVGSVTRVPFDVAVPAGVKSGETFMTSVKVEDKFIKVKLTVPEGKHSTLRFNMDIPTKSTPLSSPQNSDGRKNKRQKPFM